MGWVSIAFNCSSDRVNDRALRLSPVINAENNAGSGWRDRSLAGSSRGQVNSSSPNSWQSCTCSRRNSGGKSNSAQ